jgi:hypothetical protein
MIEYYRICNFADTVEFTQKINGSNKKFKIMKLYVKFKKPRTVQFFKIVLSQWRYNRAKPVSTYFGKIVKCHIVISNIVLMIYYC